MKQVGEINTQALWFHAIRHDQLKRIARLTARIIAIMYISAAHMSNALQQQVHGSVPAAQKNLAKLYDEHAAVVLGFLEKIAGDKQKAEELLQAVFLVLPEQLHKFDPQKGRFIIWLLNLARTIAGQEQEKPQNKTKNGIAPMNGPIHIQAENVHEPNARPLTSNSISVVELLYVKGYTFEQAAAELGVDVRSLQLMVRTELKKYRR